MKRLTSLLMVLALCFPGVLYAQSSTQSSDFAGRGISLNLTDPSGSVYLDGEAVQLIVGTDSDNYVAIFDIDTDGFVHLLYPPDGRSLQRFSPYREYTIPQTPDEQLLVGGSTGMELIFAVAAPRRDDFDQRELIGLLEDEDRSLSQRYRVTGDPFLAANEIARRLVPGIGGNPGVSMAFTYFHVNEPVDYPRYLCKDCAETGADPYGPDAPAYIAVRDFEQTDQLAYPLAKGFDLPRQEPLALEPQTNTRTETVEHVYVHYYPRWDDGYYSVRPAWYWDPWYCWPSYAWYPWYPCYTYGGFYVSVGWGWGAYHHYNYYPYYYGYGGSGYYNSGPSNSIAYRTIRKSSPYRNKESGSALYAGMTHAASRSKTTYLNDRSVALRSATKNPSVASRTVASTDAYRKVASRLGRTSGNNDALSRSVKPRISERYTPRTSQDRATIIRGGSRQVARIGSRSTVGRTSSQYKGTRRVYTPRGGTTRPVGSYDRGYITRRTLGSIERSKSSYRSITGRTTWGSRSKLSGPRTRAVQPPRSSSKSSRSAVKSNSRSSSRGRSATSGSRSRSSRSSGSKRR